MAVSKINSNTTLDRRLSVNELAFPLTASKTGLLLLTYEIGETLGVIRIQIYEDNSLYMYDTMYGAEKYEHKTIVVPVRKGHTYRYELSGVSGAVTSWMRTEVY